MFIFHLVLKCFTSQGTLSGLAPGISRVYLLGFPHSEIFGSKVARHLPEAYRCHAASFIAFSSQGIHHTPLYFPLGNLRTAYVLFVLCYSRPKDLRDKRHRITYIIFLACHSRTRYDRLRHAIASLEATADSLLDLRYEIVKFQSFC